MPWQEMSPVDLRMHFVTDWHAGYWTMSELCADYRISRKTGYKWVARHEVEGPSGLHDRSRRPHHSPQATEPRLVDALLGLRARHPRWGARKLLVVAARHDPHAAWPARSTVNDLLNAHGFIRARRPRRRYPPAPTALVRATRANQVWTTDFKGEFRTRDGRYCYPLTLRDAFSRYGLRCDALPRHSDAVTRPCFARAFAEYGLPERIRSDNGGPFASTGLGGLSQLSVWWIRLGIVPERIAPGHPEQNGSHEEFHSVLKAETARPPAADLRAQQRRFTHFLREYNDERPHESLADDVPASCYEPSPRPLPARLPALEYPAHLEVRRVSPIGQISWRAMRLFLSEALAGEYVGFEEVDDGIWTIRFATIALARLDERQGRIHPMAPFTVGRSASFAGSAPGFRKRNKVSPMSPD